MMSLLIVLCIPSSRLIAQTWPGGIHDPSKIVKCDGIYWVFGTGDGIYSMYSRDLVLWQRGPSPFTKTDFPSWINDYVGGATDEYGNPIFHGGFWAPDIIYMNNQYYLYYSCSEWGTMTSTIGCVTNKTLNPADPDYEWVDVGFLGIWSYQPGLALNAIDPSLIRGPDGKIWMVYGSFNEQGIVVTEIDSVSGKPKSYSGNLPGTSIANSWTGPQSYNYGEGEGASMIYRDGYYYLFYNKGGCCAGIASTYYIVMGRSTNPRGPFYDKNGNALRRSGVPSGGTVVLKHDDSRGQDDRYFGPGHFGLYRENGVDYVTFHYYDPNGYYPNPDVNNQGGPTLGLAELLWGEDGWTSISLNFLDEGVYTLDNLLSKKVADVFSHSLSEGAFLYQYAADSLNDTQKWIFKSLGTGEYTIQNYADPGMVVEAGGTDDATTLSVTAEFTGAVNQKFRTVILPGGEMIIYPSTKDRVWGLSLPTSSDVKLSMSSLTNQQHLRWNTSRFEETLSVSLTTLTMDSDAGTDKSILVNSNGRWSVSVFNDSWVSVEATGVRNDTLVITFAENTNAEERNNRIYITTHGGKSEIITLTQMGKQAGAGTLKNVVPINIYPNPADKVLCIDVGNYGMVTVYNATGQRMVDFNPEIGNTKLDISNWSKGIYFIRYITGDKTFIKKIVKN
ncbi:MAG: family 43 glycosylhydrolase [Bacteroidales bacterium]|nr:family 43 glycosylhydrolase [Bacteroidales bacterium]